MTSVDAWSEIAYISICAQAGAERQFQAITETVDIDIGDKGFETVATLSGGRIVKFTPQEDTTITFEAYPTQAGTSAVGLLGTTTNASGFFDLMNTADTTEGQIIPVDRTRTKYRVAILWTDETTNKNAYQAITAPTNTALRIVAADGYFISAKPSYTDGTLKWAVKFKVPPFDSSGTANVKVESVYTVTTTYTLTALASYTTATKF